MDDNPPNFLDMLGYREKKVLLADFSRFDCSSFEWKGCNQDLFKSQQSFLSMILTIETSSMEVVQPVIPDSSDFYYHQQNIQDVL